MERIKEIQFLRFLDNNQVKIEVKTILGNGGYHNTSVNYNLKKTEWCRKRCKFFLICWKIISFPSNNKFLALQAEKKVEKKNNFECVVSHKEYFELLNSDINE